MAFYGESRWPAYVPAAIRRRRLAKKVAALRKKGKALSPAVADGRGRSMARTFWGDAWCKNLESYSDYANRLPRGRTYLRNGSVVDLQVGAGRITALVQGSSLYRIVIQIHPIAAPRWKGVVGGCSGHIASLVELLRGGVSEHVMKVVTDPGGGLFPAPAEISLACSCPDWATMCKHVAASLYGVGLRLDERPELLFTLRGVDATELVAGAAGGGNLGGSPPSRAKVLDAGELSAVFGVEIDESVAPVVRGGARGGDGRAVAPATGKNAPDSTSPTPRTSVRRKEPARSRKSTGAAVRRAPPLDVGERAERFVAGNACADMSEIAEGLSVAKSALIVPLAASIGEGWLRSEGTGLGARYYPTLELLARLRPPASRLPPTSRGGRAGPEATELTARLRQVIHDRPGLRMEEISRKLTTTTSDLVLPMRKLLALNAVVKRGQKRATRYFPG